MTRTASRTQKQYKKIEKLGRQRPSALMIVLMIITSLAALTLAGIALSM